MQISTDEIHLWFIYDAVPLDEGRFCYYRNLLTSVEQEQQQRFYFAKHQQQYLLTRAMLRIILSFYESSISPMDWQFEKNPFGKPFIKHPSQIPHLNFNISHTEGVVIIAIAKNDHIGVDVEDKQRKQLSHSFMANVFAPEEVEQMQSLPEEKQTDQFFLLWTLKEAFVKACGRGISLPMIDLTCILDKHQPCVNINAQPGALYKNWQFWQVHPNNYQVSLAINSNNENTKTITLREINVFDEIEIVDYPIELIKHVILSQEVKLS